jgi:hypothetical protein
LRAYSCGEDVGLLQGHGLLGAIVAPLARGQARKQLPEDQRQLKERLERETGPPAA